jgi:hypothetical protein
MLKVIADKPKLVIPPSKGVETLEDIVQVVKLWSVASEKSRNDETNKLREQNITDFINRPRNINLQTTIRENRENTDVKKYIILAEQFRAAIRMIHPEFNTIEHTITGIGGRQTKDFVIKSKSDGQIVNNIKPIEFKFNATKLSEVPQLYQVAAKDLLVGDDITHGFAAKFFDALIPKIRELGYQPPGIDKTTYLNNVYQPNEKKHPFFIWLKNEVRTNTTFKEEVETLNHSVCTAYLSGVDQIINKPELCARTLACLSKNYILWDIKEFKTNIIIASSTGQQTINGAITPISNPKTNITLSAEYTIQGIPQKFELRLCWKNGNGILFPAWKIKMK